MTRFVTDMNLLVREPADSARPKLGSLGSRSLLLLTFLGLFFVSLAVVSDAMINFHVSYYGRKESYTAIVLLAAVIASAFLFARFSFGYFVGFYFFVMMAGYFWLNIFGTLGYDRSTALISATASIIFFLAPVLLITKPARRLITLPHAAIDALPACILGLSALVLLVSALDDFRLVGLDEIYKYRNSLDHSRFFNYFIGIFDGVLLPFAFACCFARKRWLMASMLCGVALLFYPVTLTKVSLFISFFLIFIAILNTFFEPRAVVILSLLVSTAVGLIASTINSGITNTVFGFLSFRMLTVPSFSLEHYYVFFADHPLTYFCQLSFTKGVMNCPYSDQLGVVLNNWFGLGNMNASLFAVEGVASVGPLWAPLSAFACGLVIAIGNKVSTGLPSSFILVSAAATPHILLNVPLATTLLSHGLGILFLLWYIVPRDYFEPHLSMPSLATQCSGTTA